MSNITTTRPEGAMVKLRALEELTMERLQSILTDTTPATVPLLEIDTDKVPNSTF